MNHTFYITLLNQRGVILIQWEDQGLVEYVLTFSPLHDIEEASTLSITVPSQIGISDITLDLIDVIVNNNGVDTNYSIRDAT